MGKVMSNKYFTVRQLKDGRYSVIVKNWLGKGENLRIVCNSFCQAGMDVFDLAPNHDIGRESNWKMCKVFGRNFDE